MKQIRLVSLLLLLVFCDTHGQSLMIEPGISATSMNGQKLNSLSSSRTTASSTILRPSVFLKYQKKVNARFLVEVGAGYEGKGARFIDNFNGPTNDRSINLHYVTGTVALSYKFPLQNTNQFFELGAGPYFSYLYYGSESGNRTFLFNGSVISSTILNRINISRQKDNTSFPTVFRPFDFGGNVLARYTTHRFRLSLQYGFGMKGLLTNSDLYDRQYVHSSFGLLVSYRLKKLSSR